MNNTLKKHCELFTLSLKIKLSVKFIKEKYSKKKLNKVFYFRYISVFVVRFQLALMAPTSPAAKVNEETLTYLNQGQNYDLRLSYNSAGELSTEPKMLLSVIRLCFWERKMQEIEDDEIQKVKDTNFTFFSLFLYFLILLNVVWIVLCKCQQRQI